MSEHFLPANFSIKEYEFNSAGAKIIEHTVWAENLWPLIYIIRDEEIKEAYVGESTNVLSRIQNHFGNDDRRKLSLIQLITSDTFNKSATLDIEANLIKYIAADGKYELQNGNAGLVTHSFYQKDIYFDIFKNIWKELREKQIAVKDLQEIDNSDLFKYSPYKSLSLDQYKAVLELLKHLKNPKAKSVFVQGSAGTGKTILAIYLIKLLKTDYTNFELDELLASNSTEFELISLLKEKFNNPSIALVIPMTSLRKTLKEVFRNIKGLSANMVIGPSEVLRKHYDILIVDEAHRLKRRTNITNYKSFDDNNKLLGLDETGTELDWILRQSDKQIFFYDDAQSIKPSDIPKEKFSALKSKSPVVPLKSQMRVIGGTDYIDYVDKLLNGQLTDKDDFFQMPNYEFVMFDSLPAMVNAIRIKEEEVGLSRLIAGYSWEWKSKNDAKLFDINVDGANLRWNSTNEDWINSDNAADEVGCIHTTQGYDLNYAGIIFGNEISYDPESKKIIIKSENYHDRNGKNGIKDPADLHQYIINIYKTLMYRGIKGTYVYVCDENLKKYFQEKIRSFKSNYILNSELLNKAAETGEKYD